MGVRGAVGLPVKPEWSMFSGGVWGEVRGVFSFTNLKYWVN